MSDRVVVGANFVAEMQRQLDRHQNRTPNYPRDLLVAKLLCEVAELIEALHSKNEHLTFMEAADVANMAMLIGRGYTIEEASRA